MKTIFAFHLYLICMLFPMFGNAQFLLITGNIVSGKTGNAIENVNILESNTGIGTITNLSGFFSLMLKPGNVELLISHEGFQNFSKKLVLKSDTTLTVSLLPVLNLKLKPKETEPQKTADKTDSREEK
ncbi:MAG TPA: carboxypeptidase-like regulatory domain-containing protein [Draconibacterium sp.]|nr:carboxypeptidase-like regulatory domain-containing protein [Draconibacterium sp.]HRX12129.1 carboxypeptidase-like regulatory domain-containing protein [Draconibacterium sp.]